MAVDDSGTAAGGELKPAGEEPPTAKQQKRMGIVSRVWRSIFGGRGLRSEDYEKRLQCLSKEEASVQARLQRRARSSRRMVRNIIVFSVLVEVVAVAYAVMTTRSLDLSWQMRALRVFPMFILPALSTAIYSTLVSFTRMCDRKDQKTLERLRAERKAKIDELKERTNYYTTQQLIQKYDIDPAAKAAAATVLASKLGADSGLEVYVGDQPKTGATLTKDHDIELKKSDGLRNRKQSHVRSNITSSTVASHLPNETSSEIVDDGEALVSNQKVVEHYRGSEVNSSGWIARIAALLVGEDPSQSYALICGNCHMHNGLVRKEDFPHTKYYCPHCHALNMSQQTRAIDSSSSSGITSLRFPTPSEDTNKKVSTDDSPAVAKTNNKTSANDTIVVANTKMQASADDTPVVADTNKKASANDAIVVANTNRKSIADDAPIIANDADKQHSLEGS